MVLATKSRIFAPLKDWLFAKFLIYLNDQSNGSIGLHKGN